MLILLAKSAPEKRTLYVHRPLKNGEQLAEWARSQGFAQTLDPSDMHVTVAFSRTPIDWSSAGGSFDDYRNEPADGAGDRSVVPLGDKRAVVLKFSSPELSKRWQEFRDQGASWDFPSYQPHVSITYQGKDVDLPLIISSTRS